jgi:hypothetical protein
MSANKTDSFVLTRQAVLSIFGVKSSFPNPDDDHPGPWGPVVRRAEERVRDVLGVYDLGWRDPDTFRFDVAFAESLAEEVIDRANLMQQVADALPQAGSQRAIIIIGGMLQDFVDGCGTGRIKQHFPPPRRHDDGRLTPSQLALIAARFQNAADSGMRQEFTKASEQLLETAIRHLQSAAAQAAA